MYCDLRKLEDSNTCERWLTTVDDDEKWTEYAKQNGFTDKPSTGKYEEIIFEDVRIAFCRILVDIDFTNEELSDRSFGIETTMTKTFNVVSDI